MGEPTHRVTGYIYRSRSVAEPGEQRQFEPGDLIEATDAELRTVAHKLEPLEDADAAADDDAAESDQSDTDDDASSDDGDTDAETDASDDDEDDAAEDAADDAADDAEPEEPVADFPFSIDAIEEAEYPRLRTMAGEVDGVNGRAGEDEIRQGLLEAARGE